MACLLDTGILLRIVDSKDQLHSSVRLAVGTLVDRNEELFTTTQNIAEFWNLATRPVASNGLGLAAGVVIGLLEEIIEATTGFLVEPESLYSEFKRLGSRYRFGGKQAHDARLVAMMLCWGVDKILTLNERDFRQSAAEGIAILTPDAVVRTV